jgi:hypothetical protein
MSAQPALFVPATRALVLLKSLLLNKYALNNLPLLDICGTDPGIGIAGLFTFIPTVDTKTSQNKWGLPKTLTLFIETDRYHLSEIVDHAP